ncbi:MAG: hypothetical protein KAT35_00565, partial [Candidatus Aenigmarchaeota archaeon]|nr:hypothetical protein [Candidatus Aenigmarchaeota archaeon]
MAMKKDTHRNSYLRGFERDLPDLINAIKQNSHGFRISSYEFGTPDRDESITPYEGTGLCEQMGVLLEALPLIDLPDDAGLKQDILRILYTY